MRRESKWVKLGGQKLVRLGEHKRNVHRAAADLTEREAPSFPLSKLGMGGSRLDTSYVLLWHILAIGVLSWLHPKTGAIHFSDCAFSRAFHEPSDG